MRYVKFSISVLLLVLLLVNCGGNKGPETPSSPLGPTTGEPNMPQVFRATTTDPNSDELSYQFDWGDGNASPWTDFIPSGDTASLSRVYSAEGTYQVRVHVQDEKEKMSEWSEPHSITINYPDTGTSDTNSTPLTPNSPKGPRIGIPKFGHAFRASTTDPDGDELSYQFDWGDGTVSAWTDFIPSGDTSTTNRIYWGKGTYEVRVQAKDREEEVSGWSEPLSFTIGFPDSIVSILSTSDRPIDIEVTPNGQYIFITNQDSTLLVIDASNNTPMGTVGIGGMPIGVTALPNSEYVYIMVRENNTVYALPTAGGDAEPITVPSPLYATALPSGEYVYVSSTVGNVYVIRTSDNTLVDSIDVGVMLGRITSLPNGENIYVSESMLGDLNVIRTSDNTVIDDLSFGAFGVSDMASSPNGELLYVCSSGKVYVLQTSNNIAIDTIEAGDYTSAGICVHPSGQLLYVTDDGDDCVSVVYTPTNKIIKNIEVFNGPTYIEASPDGECIYVLHKDTYVVGVIGDSQ